MVNKLLAVFFISLWTLVSYGQGMQFFDGSLEELKTQAKESNKLIFLDAYTSWCGPCRQMSKNTFTNKEVGEFYNGNFISYKMDMEKGEGVQFAKDYGVRAFPTLLFLDGDGKLIHRAVGGLDGSKFIALGQNALDPEVRLGEMIERYNDGERSSEFIKKYLIAMSGAMEDTKAAADWYFSTQSAAELLSADNYKLITRLIRNPHHPIYKFLFANKTEYQKLVPDANIDQTIFNTHQRYLSMANRQGAESFKKAKTQLEESGYDGTNKLLAISEMNDLLADKDKNWNDLIPKINDYLNLYYKNDWKKQNSMAWKIYEIQEVVDKRLLNTALAWVKKSVDLDSNYMNNDTYGALLYKLGRKNESIDALKMAIDIGKKKEKDVSGSEKLLEKVMGE